MRKYVLGFILFLAFTNLLAQESPEVIHLWENGAPGYESRKNEPEKAKDWWVKNIHNPSITVFKPENPNGSAIVICPGGGHKELVFDEEGTKAAKFLNEIGVTAIVLKYRLFREKGSDYSFKHAKQDVTRALRLVRSKSEIWGLDKNRIGLMGFSAGGEVVNSIAFSRLIGNSSDNDIIEKEDASTNFHIQIYPGPLGIPKKVKKDAPPLFLLASNNDKCCSESIFKLLEAYRTVGANVEAHFYNQGGHGFNMGDRSSFKTISSWPQRLSDWLTDNKFFQLSE